MGLLDGAGLKKLPENLLSKGDQNKSFGLKLGRTLTVARVAAITSGIFLIDQMVNFIEDTQLNLYGGSRTIYADVLKNSSPEQKPLEIK